MRAQALRDAEILLSSSVPFKSALARVRCAHLVSIPPRDELVQPQLKWEDLALKTL